MSGDFLAFTIADLAGVLTLWLLTRGGGRYPWAWSVGAWATVAALGTGLIPLGTVVPIAALTMVIGVGLIAPLVGLLAVLVLVVTPVVVAQELWGRWRRRAIAARVSQA
jgi:hypothetical protein